MDATFKLAPTSYQMRFLFYFRLSSYLLIGSGFLALLVTEDYGVLAALLFTLILAIGWQVDTDKLEIRISPFWWNLATIVFLLLCIADALFLRRYRSVALVNFLIFLQTNKLFNRKQDRDYITLYMISFFELLISAIMTMSILFALSGILFTITGTWALITLHLKREIETYLIKKSSDTDADSPPEASYANIPALNSLITSKFFAGTFGMTLVTLILALLVFAILPRTRQGIFLSYGDLGQRVSGFSEEVTLGSFGTIRLNHTPVMRVVLPKIEDETQLPTRLYWKGLSYNRYDGTRWKSDEMKRKILPVCYQQQELHHLTRVRDLSNLLEQRFELLSARLEVLFASNVMHATRGHFLSFQYDLFTGNTNVIFDPYAPNYTAYSDINSPSEAALRNDYHIYPQSIKAFYLQLPDLSDRVKELAYQVGHRAKNPYDQAVAVQDFLLQNYTYSLDVQRTPDLPPLEDFLFVNQAGHCEYYATSMAILLRILGIPTRVVNGFAQGRWNEFGRFFTVRQSDAHAWVEVFFPSYGWITFDPTPSVAFGENFQQFAERRSFVARLYRYTEYLRTRWNRYIIDYSMEDQIQAVSKAFMATRFARYNMAQSIRRLRSRIDKTLNQISMQQIGIIASVIAFSSMLLYLLFQLLSRFQITLPIFKKLRRSKRKQVIRFYQTMLRILAKKGIPKHDATTPREFVHDVAQQKASYADVVRQITDQYYAVRYGQAELTEAEIADIETILKDMKKKVTVTKESCITGVLACHTRR